MTYRQKVIALSKKLGADVEVNKDGINFTVNVEAPKGQHWNEEVHMMTEHQYIGFGTDELWKELLERMQDGTERCNCNCEYWC